LGANSYIYLFSEFSDGVINSLVNSSNIVVKNLNKFSDMIELEYRFNLHPISNGYDLYVDDQDFVEISAKFNNLTSYYNLGTQIYGNLGTTINGI